jgi:hypothetical protein
MKSVFKILKITAILILITAVTLFTASFLLQDKVTSIILKSLNKHISTKFEFESVKLSFLRKFPKASIDLRNVLVHSSPGYDPSGFYGINTDTLLSARTVTAEFKITDIIKGIYNIERIGIKDGVLNLYTDTSGNVNYHIADEHNADNGTDFTINLDRIYLSDTKTLYYNLATQLMIKAAVENSRLRSSISGDDIDFSADAVLHIDLFRLYNFTISQSIPADFDINLHSSDNGVLFNKSKVILDKYNFIMSGFVSSENVLDLSLAGEKIDLSDIKKYIPVEYQNRISAYNPSGILDIKCLFRGLLNHTTNPRIEISFNLDKGHITYRDSPLEISDLSFSGNFSNGRLMIPKTSSVTISDFKGRLGSAEYSGSLVLSNFAALNANLLLNGKLIPSEIREFFNLKEIFSSEGYVDFDLKMNGFIPRKEKYTINDILNLKSSANMNFNSFGINFGPGRFNINNVNGNFIFSDTAKARNLSFTLRDQEFTTSGTFLHLPAWLNGKPATLTFTANVACSNFDPEKLFSLHSDSVKGKEIRKAYSLPVDMIFDVNYKIDNFNYKTYSAEKVVGTVSYKPRILNFKALELNSLDGVISGNGFVVQNTDKSFMGRGSFNVDKININKTFLSFQNFGQSFIKAENLDGTLSGSFSLLIPMDSLLRPVIKSITAEGKYLLENGTLKDFEPVKELSSFIELSELENINFKQMENDFFIRNNFLYIPQMDVKSTAADLSVNGKHSFDNNYEYHVKMLLSEILSKKLHKPKPNTSEFGAVQDDGLGRISVLLKVENKGEDIKVGYDIKAAGSQVKNDIRNERQNLKSILNQEYGWFKNDSSVNKKQSTGTPRFKIIFEDNDTVKVAPEQSETKKESTLKKLFKKNN